MTDYEIVAFYKKNKEEVELHADRVGVLFGLTVRYEQLPREEVAIETLFTEKSVLCIFNREVMKFRKLLKYVYHVPKPALIIRREYLPEACNHLKVPVGYLQENKEKVVWANFFQRRNAEAQVELIVPQEKDEDIAAMVNNNLCFIENIFENSGAKYTKTFLKGSFEYVLKTTFKVQENSVIFLMRPFRVFSFYIPLNLRYFRRYAHTQTLIIPRDDKLYIPCH